jgi:glycosyltransferase involved in cell wall biosynthesis
MLSGQDVDIVVPILNEARCVDELIDRLERACPGAQLIFVDNGSTDGTLEHLETRPVRVIRHAHNEGYGKSLRDGIDAGSRPVIVNIDADLEYPPETIPRLLRELDRSPIVYGSRFLLPPAMSFARRFGNQLLTAVFNAVCGQRISDLYTGIKAFRREVVAGHRFSEPGFCFVVEFAVHGARQCQIAEAPTEYRPRASGRSKMQHYAEGFRALAALARYRWQ